MIRLKTHLNTRIIGQATVRLVECVQRTLEGSAGMWMIRELTLLLLPSFMVWFALKCLEEEL